MASQFVADPSPSVGAGNRSAPILASEALETSLLDPTCEPRWDELVISHPDSTFFHSSSWLRVLCTTYGHKPFSLLLSRNGRPASLVPLLEVNSPLTGRRGVCLPFTDFCEPLHFGQSDSGSVLRLVHELARHRNWKYFEIRGGRPFRPSATPSVRFYGHTLDLRSSLQALFARFKSSARRAIRKAEQRGVKAQLSHSREAILEFYRLHVRTRRRHGLTPQPLSFFLNIHREIIKPGTGVIVLAYRRSRPLAAAVIFYHGRKAIYKFGASDERVQDLRGNNLVIWNAISFLAENGIETLHFGRTSVENEGLQRFKRAWGTLEETIEYFRFDRAADDWVSARNNLSRFYTAIFARMPLLANRFMGSLIYPHLD